MRHPSVLAPVILAGMLIAMLSAPAVFADTGRELVVESKPLPGQIDVLQGTAIQLGGRPKAGDVQATSYLWTVIEGEGAELYRETEAEAIFQAPAAIEGKTEMFVLELTATFEDESPSSVKVFVRVHREISKMEQQQAARALKKAKKQAKRDRKRRSRSVHHHHYGSPYPSWNVGFYWGWGWPAYYPIYVPIVIPPPGIDWGPGEGEWNPPVAVPYDELVTTFPEGIAADYLPQDFPEIAGMLPGDVGAELYPDVYMDAIPEVFADPMPGGFDPVDDGGWGGPGVGTFDDPGFGGFDDPGFGGGFDTPMIDAGFDADPFGF